MHPELIPGWPIHLYGVMLVIAFYCAYFVARRTAKREGIDPNRMADVLFIAALLGIIGARGLYIIQYHTELEGFWDYFKIWKGGLVFYGGLILATVGLMGFVLWKKLPVWKLADAAAPAVMIGLAFGRIGCFLNGCCWGGVCDVQFPLGVHFPRQVVSSTDKAYAGIVPADGEWRAIEPVSLFQTNERYRIVTRKELEDRARENPREWEQSSIRWVRRMPRPDGTVVEQQIVGSSAYLQHLTEFPDRIGPDATKSLAVHPTQLYESSSALLIAGILYVWWRWRRRPGEVFALMGVLYPVARFIIEGLRNDTAPVLGPLTLGQVTSIPVFVIAVIAFIYCRFAAGCRCAAAKRDKPAASK
jgi:phosphatidylglycerol:prolipoprotein diacylglycerol transferase